MPGKAWSMLPESIKRPLRPIKERLMMALGRREVARFWRDGGNAALLHPRLPGGHPTIVDVGGYHGEWASCILEGNPGARVHILEPVPAFHQSIAAKFAADQRVSTHRCGLGDAPRTDRISLDSDASSIHRQAGSAQLVDIRVEDAAVWLQTHAAEGVALMKLNVEGSEYQIIDRLSTSGAMRSIGVLLVQFHDFIPECDRLMRHAHALLRRTHRPVFRYRYVWERWDRLGG